MDRIAPYHLRTLLAIEAVGSFSGAAEQLGTTQPAVSLRIRELETQLGIKLFERHGRQMFLTARGRQLANECRPVLNELNSVLSRVSSRSLASGIVRVGSGEIASATCLPALVRRAADAYPTVTLDVQIDLTARMLQSLLTRRWDLVFFAGPIAHPAIKTVSLGTLDLVWLSNPACAQKDEPALWTLPEHSPIHHIAREEVLSQGVRHRSFNICSNVRTLIDIVRAGGGIALLPETMTRSERKSGSLVEVIPRPSKTVEFQAAMHIRQTDPLVTDLFNFVGRLNVDPGFNSTT